MSRPRFEDIYMDLAEALSKRSTCKRLQVGCVITEANFQSVCSIGYNGNAAKFPNQCDTDTPGSCGDIHAECNAIIKNTTPAYVPKIVFVTHLPCVMCAKMMVNMGGIQKVYYRHEYRIKDSIVLLRDAGIDIEQLDAVQTIQSKVTLQ